MNINEKFFSFPPYLSTSWAQVSALSITNQGNIAVHMNSGETILLPELSKGEMELVFRAHAGYLENQVLNEPIFREKKLAPSMREDLPFRVSFGSMDGAANAMQHNPAQRNAPNLPEEMLFKIAEVSRILGPDDPDQIPKPEPHCNCYHCQIARALNQSHEQSEKCLEEEVSAEDLEFAQWEITQVGDQRFNVINKLDTFENYSVHLGNPVGCTCGKLNCEHILAVLKS